jgi:hypothetical protein
MAIGGYTRAHERDNINESLPLLSMPKPDIMVPQKIPQAVEDLTEKSTRSLTVQEIEIAMLRKSNRAAKQDILAAQHKITRLECELLDIRERSGVSSLEMKTNENAKLTSQLSDTHAYLDRIQQDNVQLKKQLVDESLEKLSFENQLADAQTRCSKQESQIAVMDTRLSSLANSHRIDLQERIKFQDMARCLTMSVDSLKTERDLIIADRKKIIERLIGEAFKAQSDKECLVGTMQMQKEAAESGMKREEEMAVEICSLKSAVHNQEASNSQQLNEIETLKGRGRMPSESSSHLVFSSSSKSQVCFCQLILYRRRTIQLFS